MANAVTEQKQQSASPATAALVFRQTCTKIAGALLKDWVGEDRAAEATGRVSCALASSAASARNPTDFYECTPQSIGTVIAVSALTGIMPSVGATALAYAIPRRPRKGEPPQLTYQLSHRGLAALARRCGQTLVATPIGYKDVIDVDSHGSAVVRSRDIDQPPLTMEELRGVIVSVKDTSTGAALFCGWVPKTVIEKRRACSDAYKFAVTKEYAQATDPWHQWPIEQSMKTAMHYAVSRGWCVIDDSESVRALSADAESQPQVIEGHVEGKRIGKLDDLTDRLTDPSPGYSAETQKTSADGLREFSQALTECKNRSGISELMLAFAKTWESDQEACDAAMRMADDRIAELGG